MKTSTKWILVALLLFSLVFAVGCAKSVMEGENSVSTGSAKMQMIEARPAMPAVDMAYDMDVIYGESAGVGYEKSMMPYPEPMPPYPEDHFGSGDEDVELQIIRTAYMDLEVDDYFLASQKVEAYAKKYGGYVSNSDARADHNDKHSGTITMRIPEIHFDAVMAEISMLGDIKSKSSNGQDVTEEYIDLEARLENAQAHEDRLVAMYANATSVKEMMSVENELSRVREEVERYEGRLRYLTNRVAMSTITVNLHEPSPVVKEWGVWQSVKDAIDHSLETLRWMIELIGWLLPLILLGIVVGLLIRLLRRKTKRR